MNLLLKILESTSLRLSEHENTGRELEFVQGSFRTVRLYFAASDYPVYFQKILSLILVKQHAWIRFNRFGELNEQYYPSEEMDILTRKIAGELSGLMNGTTDDFYLLAEDGDLFVSIDHHIEEDGIGLYLSNIELASELASELMTDGVEYSVYST